MDARKLKDDFALVGANGTDVAEYFYADLFTRDPKLRSRFPTAMAEQHEVLLAALSQIVSSVDDTDALVPFPRDLGRHHGYGIAAEHYAPVGASLPATLDHFSGPDWNEDLERDRNAAYSLVEREPVRILSQAQQTADLYVADAERYTRELSHEARLHREAILSDAKGHAEQMLEEAHRESAAVAGAAVREAAPPARPGPLPDDERRAMEREIAYLRTYSDVCRTHLRSYLEALLRNVDEWEASERASVPDL